jgi:hypothetical protein
MNLKHLKSSRPNSRFVALAPYFGGRSFIVATDKNLFEADTHLRRVTVLKFREEGSAAGSSELKPFEELAARHTIVAMTNYLGDYASLVIATASNLFEVNLHTQLVTPLKFCALDSKV